VGAYDIDVFFRFIEQSADFAAFLTLQNEIAHKHFRFAKHRKKLCEIAVVRQVVAQVQPHGIDDVALRGRFEHRKELVCVFGSRTTVAAHSQIGLNLLLVEPNGVHQGRLTVVQIGVFSLYKPHISVEQFTEHAEKKLRAEKEIKEQVKYTGNKDAAAAVGKAVAERALAKGVQAVAFDRSGFKYHGRVQTLADAAREAGLQF